MTQKGDYMKLSENFVLRSIAGESMLIPVGEASGRVNGIITLNEVGVLIWNALTERCDPAHALEKIMEAYEVDEQTARTDLEAFLEEMEKLGILQR